MKEIYVIKEKFGSEYRAIDPKEIEELKNEATIVEVILHTEAPSVTIHLYEQLWFTFFGIPEDMRERMVKDYLNYVSSITGFDMPEVEF